MSLFLWWDGEGIRKFNFLSLLKINDLMEDVILFKVSLGINGNHPSNRQTQMAFRRNANSVFIIFLPTRYPDGI